MATFVPAGQQSNDNSGEQQAPRFVPAASPEPKSEGPTFTPVQAQAQAPSTAPGAQAARADESVDRSLSEATGAKIGGVWDALRTGAGTVLGQIYEGTGRLILPEAYQSDEQLAQTLGEGPTADRIADRFQAEGQAGREQAQAITETVGTTPEERQQTIEEIGPTANMLFEIGGSTLPFFALGPSLAAFAGSSAGRADFARDAEQSGALGGAVDTSETLGALFGAGQALPVVAAFNRLGGKMTPEVVKEVVDKLPAQKTLGVLGRMGATGAAEAVQETLLYEVPKNLTARDMVGYDPDRNIWQGTPEIAAGGFTVGAIAQGILEGVAGKRLARYEKSKARGEAFTKGELDAPYFTEQTEKVAEKLGPRKVNDRALKRLAESNELVGAEADVVREVAALAGPEGLSSEQAKTAVSRRMLPLTQDTFEGSASQAEVDQAAQLAEDVYANEEMAVRETDPRIREQLVERRKAKQAELDSLYRNVQERKGEFVRRYDSPITRPGSAGMQFRNYYGHVEGRKSSDGVTEIHRLTSELFEPQVSRQFIQEDLAQIRDEAQVQRQAIAREYGQWVQAERGNTKTPGLPTDRSPLIQTLMQENLKVRPEALAEMPSSQFDKFVRSRLASLGDRAARADSIVKARKPERIDWKKALAREELVRAGQRSEPVVRFARGDQKLEKFLRSNYDVRQTPDGQMLEVQVPEAYSNGVFAKGLMPGEMAQLWGQVKDGYRKLNIEGIDEIGADLASFGKGKQLWMTLLQTQREFPQVQGLQEYVGNVRNWWREKMFWTERADQRIKDWRKLGGKRRNKLSEFIVDVAERSFMAQRRLTEKELVRVGRKHGMDEGMFKVWRDMEQDFSQARETLRRTALEHVDRAFHPRQYPEANAEHRREINDEFDALANTNYFPFARFGDHIVIVQDRNGNTVERQQFETQRAARKGAERARKAARTGEKVIERSAVEDTEFQSIITGGLQAAIEKNVQLTPEQQSSFRDLIVSLSPVRSFAKNMLRRRGTPGFTRDAMRSYADYFRRFSGHSAKFQFMGEMSENVRQVQEEGMILAQRGRQGGSTKTHDAIANSLNEHMEYLSNPPNELAGLRSTTFLMYLGWNVKSAYVNLTQTALVTYPYLAARYGGLGIGDMRSVSQLMRAGPSLLNDKALGSIEKLMGKASRDASESFAIPGRMEKDLQDGLARAVREGIIDESLATELASAATSSGAEAFVPVSAVGRTGRMAARSGTFLFQTVEKFNRRVSFIAGHRLARQEIAKGRPWHLLSESEKNRVYEQAREAVEMTQYEYARWNRPKFMRGKKGIIFMFYQHIQNTLHFMTKEPGRGRAWMVLLATAGLLGLPFAEDISDLLDALFTQYPDLRKKFGLSEKPMTDLRQEARQMLNDMTDDERVTDLMLHGAGREYGLGPLHAMEMLGAPIPNVDLSGSLSFGNVEPGVTQGVRALSYGADPAAAAFRSTENVLGATAGIFGQMYRAATSDDPSTIKRVERVLPQAFKNAVESWGWWQEGGVTDYSGAKIIEFDPNDPYGEAQTIANALSFRLTDVSREEELRWAQRMHAMFYTGRRTQLMKQYTFAIQEGDDELKGRYMKEIRKYNSTVPNKALAIGGDDLMRSVMTRIESRAKQEAGLPRQNSFIADYQRLREAYPKLDQEMRQEGLTPPPKFEKLPAD